MSALELPADALVVLVGAAASGKSTWAAAHFEETEVVSSDRCRELVSDDPTDQGANPGAFAVFYEILWQRARLGRLSVADSTALQPFARGRLRAVAQRAGVPVHAVVFLTPLPRLLEMNRLRARQVPEPVLRRHAAMLEELVADRVLESEGYAAIHYLPGPVPLTVRRVEQIAAPQPAGTQEGRG